MTALGQINAGGHILASLVRGVAPIVAYKSVAEVLSTGVGTLQNDDALAIPLDTNSMYIWLLSFGYKGGAAGSSDLKYDFAIPAGMAYRFSQIGVDTAGNAGVADRQSGGNVLGTGGSVSKAAVFAGSMFTTSSSGTFQFRWCQNSGTATATTVFDGAFLAAWKIA